MIPMKDVTAKPRGMVKNCDHKASLGFLAKRAKSGSLTYDINQHSHPRKENKKLKLSKVSRKRRQVKRCERDDKFRNEYLTINVAKLAMLLIIPWTIAQPSAPPDLIAP